MPKKQSGLAPVFILIIIAALGVGAIVLKPWEKISNIPFTQLAKAPEATQPKLDLRLATTLEVDPQKGATIRVVDSKSVLISLEIPPNALKQKEKITLIPFEATSSATPTQGVMISPENLNFLQPVSLTFSFNLSEIENDAPEKGNLENPRSYGKSQVLRLSVADKTLTQVLVARFAEAKYVLPARILRGGAYVFSLDGKFQKEFARQTLASDKSSASSKIEAAISLLALGVKLTSQEVEVAKVAVSKILELENPALIELNAAAILDKKLKEFKSYLINTVFAQSSFRGYIDFRCKHPSSSYQDIIRAAAAASTFGFKDLYQSCIELARNKLRAQKDEILKNTNNVGELVQLLNDFQLLALEEPPKFGTDPYVVQVQEKINQVLNEKMAKLTDPDYGRTPTEERKQVRDLGKVRKYGIDPTVTGMIIGEALGLKTFDEAGIKSFGDAWIPGLLQAESELVRACHEIGGDAGPKFQEYCARFVVNGELRGDILKVQQDLHKAGQDVGNIQQGKDAEKSAQELEELDKYYRETLPQKYGIDPAQPITYPSTDEESDIKYKAPIDDEQPGYEVEDASDDTGNE